MVGSGDCGHGAFADVGFRFLMFYFVPVLWPFFFFFFFFPFSAFTGRELAGRGFGFGSSFSGVSRPFGVALRGRMT